MWSAEELRQQAELMEQAAAVISLLSDKHELLSYAEDLRRRAELAETRVTEPKRFAAALKC
ncbi:hypothetical protein LJR219_005146 [Phenylobacterium sp. LjRoot219]|uniref:hypothetical protein n=1 Tax=Phenylobacterium sp. LjRoot219 TaxID=3342283 RepID=UPI003ED01C22